MIAARANPFSVRGALALVLGGALLFVALLWMIGTGLGTGSVNDGGNHAGGKGLNGFAALHDLLESSGYDVRTSRDARTLNAPDFVVLTPSHGADAQDLNEILLKRRYAGPTLLVLPKWQAMALPAAIRPKGAKEGWVALAGSSPPPWARDLRRIAGNLDARIEAGSGAWSGLGLSGRLPDASAVQTMSSGRIISLVRDSRGQMLAGRVDSDADYPLVIVAEPDLLDNYGLAREANAQLAVRLIASMSGNRKLPIAFDLTLNGHERKTNLLSLAFTPPFLAATLCLLLAALVIGWRAFLRFGPPRRPERAIAFGKHALVANSAGLVRRTRRLHLLTGPYVDQTRETVARSLALARQPDPAATEAAIDRALASRDPGATPFSHIAARLRRAQRPHEAISAARELHALERKLIHE